MRAKENMAVAEATVSQYLVSLKTLTKDDIKKAVLDFKPIFEKTLEFDDADISQLEKNLETHFITSMGVGISLVDQEKLHDDSWPSKREIEWVYWRDYEKLLIEQRWSPTVVNSLGLVADKILGLLKNPEDEGEWYRRGLVLGHVQSGKTANYIGVLSKAADAGYKFIIVIAGIHNNLRKQTQERIDEGFIGRDSLTRKPVGVGIQNPNRPYPVTLTNADSDFNKALASTVAAGLEDYNKPVVLVIKKNVSTLTNLYAWLRELNTKAGRDKIVDVPMLMIDDEADNASINTREPELDPTRINSEIRRIISLFRKRCYVGYTATPFANIFINPDSASAMLDEDLFPKDFIHCLDAPSNYFGSDKVFLDEQTSPLFLRTNIEDIEGYIPIKHKKDEIDLRALPPSLERAIRVFVLSRAIRILRGQSNKHASMMVNVSRFVNVQRQVRDLIDMYLKKLCPAIRFNYMKTQEAALKDDLMKALKVDFDSEFSTAGFAWMQIQGKLNEAAETIKVFLINSKSGESLDYKAYEKDGHALAAITVGGLSLSRGLTLEGLTVSYIYRNSKMYDTLMQMGRWFGYRPGYEDLCRVYMTESSRSWYSHIAEATDDLRQQISRMQRNKKSPKDFGLYVRAHPDALIVTAMNKMRHAEKRNFSISYDGKTTETYTLPEDEKKNSSNRALIKQQYAFFTETTEGRKYKSENKFLFCDVEWAVVHDFLLKFRFHADFALTSSSLINYGLRVADLFPKWDVYFFSPSNKPVYLDMPIAEQERKIDEADPVGEPGRIIDRYRIKGSTDGNWGLDKSQLVHAEQIAIEAGRKNPGTQDFTDARGKPILIIHLLNIKGGKTESGEKTELHGVPALSIGFPHSDEFREVDIVAGPVLIKQLEQQQRDLAREAEDDYDLV